MLIGPDWPETGEDFEQGLLKEWGNDAFVRQSVDAMGLFRGSAQGNRTNDFALGRVEDGCFCALGRLW